MMRSNSGATLIELLFAMAIGMTVVAVGCSTYIAALRADESGARIESARNTARELMRRIGADVRSASYVNADSGSLRVAGTNGPVLYTNVSDGSGVERLSGGAKRLYGGVRARFEQNGGGVVVKVTADPKAPGRNVQYRIESFFVPRNR